MKLVTIQSRKVLKLLKMGITYKSDFEIILGNHLDSYHNYITEVENIEIAKIKSYQVLMRYYGFNDPPIFCCVVDKIVNFMGTKRTAGDALLELEVPDEFVHLHKYDSWRDIYDDVYYNEWDEIKYEFLKDHFDNIIEEDYLGSIQAVIPYIKSEWLIGVYYCPKKFITTYEEEYLCEDDYVYLKIHP